LAYFNTLKATEKILNYYQLKKVLPIITKYSRTSCRVRHETEEKLSKITL